MCNWFYLFKLVWMDISKIRAKKNHFEPENWAFFSILLPEIILATSISLFIHPSLHGPKSKNKNFFRLFRRVKCLKEISLKNLKMKKKTNKIFLVFRRFNLISNIQSSFTRAHPLIRHPSLNGIFSKVPTFLP